MSKFEDLLKELSDLMGSPLVPDSKSTCLLVFQNEVKIQLELDRTEEYLIIGARLGELPAGKFREMMLIEALKSNRDTEAGVLAFSLKKKELVLCDKKLFESISATSLFDLLKKMSEKGEVWQTALKNGRVPALQSSSPHPSIFGLGR